MPCQCNCLQCNTEVDYRTVEVEGIILPFKVELDLDLSVLQPLPGDNQIFCYRITGLGSDNPNFKDLSHWVLSICPDITLEEIDTVTVTIDGVPQTVVIGENVQLFIPPQTDPQTGCPGLKFDFGLSKILDDPNSVGLFCIELKKPYPVGDVNVCLKGGQTTASGLMICGPVCPEVCETTASQLIDICVPVTVQPTACVGPAKTICCGPSYVSDIPCTGIPGGTCTFNVSQTICVEVPVKFKATATPGDTYVTCGDAAEGECVCPTDNNNNDSNDG